MYGYSAAKGVENVLRNAGASEDAAKTGGMATALGSVLISQDPGGLAYMAEQQGRMDREERRSSSNRRS